MRNYIKLINITYILLLLSAFFIAGWVYGGEYEADRQLCDFWGRYYDVGKR